MDHGWTDAEFSVPRIDEDKLQELIERFTPAYCVEEKIYRNDVLVDTKTKIHTIKIPNLRNVAFTWDPVLDRKVKFKELMRVKTYHSCGYHAFVKPSIAEVLANIQFNKDVLESKANAFYIDMNYVDIHKSGEGHILTTVFGKI